MKKLIVKIALVTLTSGWLVTANSEENLVSAGYSGAAAISVSGGSTSASFIKAEYERKLSELITISAGLGALSYKSTSSGYRWTYAEDGKGPSIFTDMIFYPGKKSFSGFYVGPGVGLTPISVNWSETNTNTGVTKSDSYTASLFDIHARVGWKINTGAVVIDPNVRLGYFLNSPTGGTSQGSSLGIYLLLGVNVGVPF